MPSLINADNGVVSGSVGLKYSTDNTGTLALQTNGNTAVTIDSNRRVGIGTTTPTSGCLLDVKGGDIRAENTSGSIRLRLVGGSNQYSLETSSGTNALQFIDAAAGLERMRINSNGQITMPYQPAIFIALGTQQQVQTGDYYKIQLDDAVLNRGSHWNTSTKRFTAPVSGVYYINLSAYIYGSGSADANVYIYVNGGLTMRGFSYNPTNQSDANPGGAQLNATYYLNTGDYLEPYYVAGSTSMSIWNGGPYATHLCVYLLG